MEIQVLRKGNARCKLTIAKDRVTLKLSSDVNSEREERYVWFAKRIATLVQPTLTYTLRGTFRNDPGDPCSILLSNGKREHWEGFTESDFEEEPHV
jgi:hypothetical protein